MTEQFHENHDFFHKHSAQPSQLDGVDLRALQETVESLAKSHGLDFYPIVFEPVSARELNMIAAREGFPVRYPHWRWAMEYNRLAKGYEYGTQRIYELVINTDPVYAYLLQNNALLDQKLVMAHVYGHADFFKNNRFFSPTNHKMLDQMGDHASRIKGYMDQFGEERVERWIDVCRSVENLIGPYSVPIGTVTPIDTMLNQSGAKYPLSPERDIVRFLIQHSPIEQWQRDILSIVRDEALYFQPQAQTKIMNEGWASYWHTTLLAEQMLLAPEVVDYCDRHSGATVMQNGRFNPYKVGLELFRDIEQRWNKGQFGPDYEGCTELEGKRSWDKKLGLGRKKIFEVRRDCNDITFLDEYLTIEFCERFKLISYEDQKPSYEERLATFKEYKEQLLSSLSNRGQPVLELLNANHDGERELYLKHRHLGTDLDQEKAKATISNLYEIWKRAVHVETVLDGKPTVMYFDGRLHMQRPVQQSE